MHKRLVNTLLLLGLPFSITACQSTDDAQSTKERQPVKTIKAPVSSKPKVETIHDVKISADSIQFTVISNGCTKSKNFVLDVNQVNKDTYDVTLLRLKPDYCRAMPRLITITKPLKQLNNINHPKIVINNPFSTKKPGRGPTRLDKQ